MHLYFGHPTSKQVVRVDARSLDLVAHLQTIVGWRICSFVEWAKQLAEPERTLDMIGLDETELNFLKEARAKGELPEAAK